MDESVKVGPVHVPARLSSISTKTIKKLAKKKKKDDSIDENEVSEHAADGEKKIGLLAPVDKVNRALWSLPPVYKKPNSAIR